MSDFKADVRCVASVKHHPNADKLDIITITGLDGIQVIVGRDEFVFGERIIYIPEDAIIPDDLKNKLGLEKNRIKVVKLRGEISNGVVLKTDEPIDKDMTEELGIVKYDPEPIHDNSGNMYPLPKGVEKYDIQSINRYADVLDHLIKNKTPVIVTEKLEGTNMAIVAEEEIKVCTRRHEKEDGPNFYWETARKHSWLVIAKKIRELLKADQVVLRGELIGPKIEKNHYHLNERELRLFDIKVDGTYLNDNRFYNVLYGTCQRLQLTLCNRTVPVIGVNAKKFREVKAADGISFLADVLREGIVIKPTIEMTHPKIGRLILKRRGLKYLERKNAKV